jgi:hypothetical protein
MSSTEENTPQTAQPSTTTFRVMEAATDVEILYLLSGKWQNNV